MWEIKIEHKGLGKYRTVRDADRRLAHEKANAQLRAWDEQWERKKETERKGKARERAAKNKEQKLALALEKTTAAEDALRQIDNTLGSILNAPHRTDWNSLKDRREFPTKRPAKPKVSALPSSPSKNDPKYLPKVGLLGLILGSVREEREKDARLQFEKDVRLWKREVERIAKRNDEQTKRYEDRLSKWESQREAYKKKRDKNNKEVSKKKRAYESGESAAVVDYCGMILSRSEYPDGFPQEYDLDYNADTRMLVVDYSMPSKDKLPVLKTVRYIASRDEFRETTISESALNKMYDSLLYQMSLRTIYELLDADAVGVIDSIVLNGWVTFHDSATGREVTACILSIQASKDEFLQINLANVDPKACFRELKGVGSSRLSGLTPVAPILRIDRTDRRFVSHYDVVDALDDSTNLAAMDWQDFENLIREVFEKEFAQGGGEVKVTQASRDGGVDAIAFDPDPIRGGKIVIQAKRYTNAVGLSAIRDLYGTVVNEGATKGILVTTSVYGPDAYEFAKDKPLSLLNGSNLLHLLEKHGQRARIDLAEAKVMLADAQ